MINEKSKVYYYKAKIDKEKYKYLRTQSFLNKLFDNKLENLVNNYLKYEKNNKK